MEAAGNPINPKETSPIHIQRLTKPNYIHFTMDLASNNFNYHSLLNERVFFNNIGTLKVCVYFPPKFIL